MFLAVGCSAGTSDKALPAIAVSAALFHLFTHAFFKALLFLSAGSVMHAMGDVIDMRRFGGLRRALPYTHIAFLCGAVALAGLPVFAGFWSKDAILDVAAHAAKESKYGTYFAILRDVLLVTSFLTAFYTFRAYFLTFHGQERFPAEAGDHPHESPPVMLVPLALLSIAALTVGGLFGLNFTFELPGSNGPISLIPAHLFAHYLEPMFVLDEAVDFSSSMGVMLMSTVIAVGGLLLAYQCYIRDPSLPERMTAGIKLFVEASQNRFYLDEIYDAAIVKPLEKLAPALPKFDRHSLDKVVEAIGALPGAVGKVLRPIQNGFVQSYGAWMLIGLAALLVLMVSSFG
jgi:NADH-quinone oxidoreductase subunit L